MEEGRLDMVEISDLYTRGLKRRQKMFGEAEVGKRMAASGAREPVDALRVGRRLSPRRH